MLPRLPDDVLGRVFALSGARDRVNLAAACRSLRVAARRRGALDLSESEELEEAAAALARVVREGVAVASRRPLALAASMPGGWTRSAGGQSRAKARTAFGMRFRVFASRLPGSAAWRTPLGRLAGHVRVAVVRDAGGRDLFAAGLDVYAGGGGCAASAAFSAAQASDGSERRALAVAARVVTHFF